MQSWVPTIQTMEHFIFLYYSATYFHENEGTLPSVSFGRSWPMSPKVIEEKKRETNEDAGRALLKLILRK